MLEPSIPERVFVVPFEAKFVTNPVPWTNGVTSQRQMDGTLVHQLKKPGSAVVPLSGDSLMA